jgi:rhamnogalacturonan endolyase
MWREWGQGRDTTWTVKFTLPANAKSVPQNGTGILRVALAGADGPGGLAIAVNGAPAGVIHPVSTNALRYNTDKGVWYQYALPFPANFLKPGDNAITFTVPAGDVTTGVVWDYVRLELNDGAKPYPPLPNTERPDFPTRPTNP